MKKKAIVIHSGGMDSSICLELARRQFGAESVLSLSFRYNQRHQAEIEQAKKICTDWGIDHTILSIDSLAAITENALTNRHLPIEKRKGAPPNTLVVGRNGLMARLGAIHANHLGAQTIFMGVMELEGANSGYRDCSRAYMNLKEQILRHDLNDPSFTIQTPLIRMTKKETLKLAEDLGILDYLLENTITCYEGIPRSGCGRCPACELKNAALKEFYSENRLN